MILEPDINTLTYLHTYCQSILSSMTLPLTCVGKHDALVAKPVSCSWNDNSTWHRNAIWQHKKSNYSSGSEGKIHMKNGQLTSICVALSLPCTSLCSPLHKQLRLLSVCTKTYSKNILNCLSATINCYNY